MPPTRYTAISAYGTSPSRLGKGPEGLLGGEPGAGGRFLVNGQPVSEARKITMQPGDRVLLETPGGGAA